MPNNPNAQRVAAVTGGSSGIGLAAAKLFAEKGYAVYCLSRTAPAAGGLCFIATDVTNEASVAAAFAKIGEEQGRLDVLVSNAGMGVSGPVECTSLEDAKHQFDVNVFGLHACARHAIPLMRRTGDGSIVATSSVAAVFSIPFQGFYSASKFAVNALVLAMRNELARFNIRVCAVMPGDVKTGFTDARVKDHGADIYGACVDASVAVMEHDEHGGMAPEVIAKKIVKLAESKNPKPLSTVGLQYKVFCFLGKVLPIRLQSFLVGKIYIKKGK
jgi:NAD(P)-dependent dehydrogenase (short-subunit alcohol dehydrogenase family)